MADPEPYERCVSPWRRGLGDGHDVATAYMMETKAEMDIIMGYVDDIHSQGVRAVDSMETMYNDTKRIVAIKAGEEVFDHMDANGDGNLSCEEVTNYMAKNPQLREQMQNVNSDKLDKDWTALVDMLDADGGGVVDTDEFSSFWTRSELGTKEEAMVLFKKMDKDGGGTLNTREIKTYLREHPELRERLVEQRTAGLAKQWEGFFDMVRDGTNGALDRAQFASLWAASGLGLNTSQAAKGAAPTWSQRLMAMLDADGGGTVDVEEFAGFWANSGLGSATEGEEIFKQMDRSGDGSLETKEIKAYISKHPELRDKLWSKKDTPMSPELKQRRPDSARPVPPDGPRGRQRPQSARSCRAVTSTPEYVRDYQGPLYAQPDKSQRAATVWLERPVTAGRVDYVSLLNTQQSDLAQRNESMRGYHHMMGQFEEFQKKTHRLLAMTYGALDGKARWGQMKAANKMASGGALGAFAGPAGGKSAGRELAAALDTEREQLQKERDRLAGGIADAAGGGGAAAEEAEAATKIQALQRGRQARREAEEKRNSQDTPASAALGGGAAPRPAPPAAPAPAQHRRPPPPPFDGGWDVPGGITARIRGTLLTWSDGTSQTLEHRDGGMLAMELEGEWYTGELTSTGGLHWSDGDLWTRRGS